MKNLDYLFDDLESYGEKKMFIGLSGKQKKRELG